jgi:hypothetical protein
VRNVEQFEFADMPLFYEDVILNTTSNGPDLITGTMAPTPSTAWAAPTP